VEHLIIISYGGLRGAMSYTMAQFLKDDRPLKDHFQAATLIVVLLTCFVQGGTMKFMVMVIIKKRT